MEYVETFRPLIEVLTLVALIVYVYKTWHIAYATKESSQVSKRILDEMKATREQQTSPYVVAFFDVSFPRAQVDLVVKNIGRSIAEEVRIDFEPQIRNSFGDKLSESSWVKQGFGSIPPGGEIRTFLDLTHRYFGRGDLPLKYTATVTYRGSRSKTE